METITINEVEYQLDSDERGIFIDFNSDDVNFTDSRLSSNGLKKRLRLISLKVTGAWNIETSVLVEDISPSGVVVSSKEFTSYTSSEADTDLFRTQGEVMVNSAVYNGMFRYILKNTRAVKQLDGTLITEQPVPMPEEGVEE